jgi:hypothetical protein
MEKEIVAKHLVYLEDLTREVSFEFSRLVNFR